MKKALWFFLIISAILYAIPFLFSDTLWWLIFVFPVPLLYITLTQDLSFIHGYVWGIIVFGLHLHAGILVVAQLAGDWWWVGLLMGIGMVLYQALVPATLLWGATILAKKFLIKSPLFRIFLYAVALVLFMWWIDQYCMWIFGIKEGYPFMHPLLMLAQHPSLLSAFPFLGKQLLLLLFLLVPISIVLGMWYKNYVSLLMFMMSITPWIWWGMHQPCFQGLPEWHQKVCSLPCMIRGHNAQATMRILVQHIKKLIATYPKVSIIIMPESALDIIDYQYCKTKQSLHLIVGGCFSQNSTYYNSLYWIHNGMVQARYDKKHAMLMTERMADWMNTDWLRTIYFKDDISIARSYNERKLLQLSESIAFVPYICSELFFNEYPDDCYPNVPILAIVNDTLLMHSYLHNLLLLLAQFKAIQWQRDIVYVSYGACVFIDNRGMMKEMSG